MAKTSSGTGVGRKSDAVAIISPALYQKRTDCRWLIDVFPRRFRPLPELDNISDQASDQPCRATMKANGRNKRARQFYNINPNIAFSHWGRRLMFPTGFSSSHNRNPDEVSA
ncbi:MULTISPECIES: hypothetical protein [Sphingobium]|jgi:hypothetical protein|uniref:hypothetical protein n=1 Tax=Sphingobium TaxID=165695 RepID=UPI0013EAC53C|nr:MULTISPECIES: hypothetical protein [Sphingobium]UXC93035.1 hypothetical protein EGM87_22320 [Sphingobium sp. RSMS]WDA35697.1 hypothetical protein PO876_19920 [Sphingobium sp. YC-XJ3]